MNFQHPAGRVRCSPRANLAREVEGTDVPERAGRPSSTGEVLRVSGANGREQLIRARVVSGVGRRVLPGDQYRWFAPLHRKLRPVVSVGVCVVDSCQCTRAVRGSCAGPGRDALGPLDSAIKDPRGMCISGPAATLVLDADWHQLCSTVVRVNILEFVENRTRGGSGTSGTA